MIDLKLISKCASVLSDYKGAHESLNICTDTRKYHHPAAFVAIPGAKVNPLDVIEKLLSEGCPLVIFQDDETNRSIVTNLKKNHPKTEFLAVSDSVTFLQEISHEHIVQWQKKSPRNIVFAISGSNGKTTHKEMLSHILKNVVGPSKIVATEKNNNNHLGVPLTLLDVKDETQFVVLELGSNHPGEIKVLCDIAHPQAGLTTNIGATHLEFFGSEEKVFEEEGYLFHAVNELTSGKGFFLINIDDSYLKSFKKTPGSITYGENKEADAKVSYTDQGAKISYQGKILEVSNTHITGQHNKLNLITTLFIAQNFYPELTDAFTKSAAEFRPTKNRSEWIEFSGKPVYLDAYNANPSSMKASLSGFKESVLAQGLNLNESCVVLGDMNELGDATPTYHRDLGQFIGELGFTNVHFVGRFSQHYLAGFPSGKGHASSQEFKREYREQCLKDFAIHFIKGSRSLQLESLFDIT